MDTLNVAWHGVVNFGGGVVNALADTADLVVDVVQTSFNAVSPTCWTKSFCAAIPNIPSVPIYGDPALYKYSQGSGYLTTVAVEFVAGGAAKTLADGASAVWTGAKALPRLVTELPAVVNDVKSAVKAVVPAVKALVPRLPGLIKTTVTGVADNAASIVKNPGAFLNDLKTGLNNPITTKGGIFGTAPATTAADADALEAGTGADVPGLVYRGGSDSDMNMTPRPGIDGTGLSTFDNPAAAAPNGGKVQVIDTSRLTCTVACPDAPPVGHVSIVPADGTAIAEWADTRTSGAPNPYTQDVINAIIEEIRVAKP